MDAEKRRLLSVISDVVTSSGEKLASPIIEEEDLMKIVKTLTYSSMAIQAIVEPPDKD